MISKIVNRKWKNGLKDTSPHLLNDSIFFGNDFHTDTENLVCGPAGQLDLLKDTRCSGHTG